MESIGTPPVVTQASSRGPARRGGSPSARWPQAWRSKRAGRKRRVAPPDS